MDTSLVVKDDAISGLGKAASGLFIWETPSLHVFSSNAFAVVGFPIEVLVPVEAPTAEVLSNAESRITQAYCVYFPPGKCLSWCVTFTSPSSYSKHSSLSSSSSKMSPFSLLASLSRCLLGALLRETRKNVRRTSVARRPFPAVGQLILLPGRDTLCLGT